MTIVLFMVQPKKIIPEKIDTQIARVRKESYKIA